MLNTLRGTAESFFIACESGKGWAACQQFCHADATFSAQADALAGMTLVSEYTDWMHGNLAVLPDASYELRAFAVDEVRQSVIAFGVFRGTHTGEGGPVPPTGKSMAADYVYVMEFAGERICHLTKIWNDGFSLRQLGWA